MTSDYRTDLAVTGTVEELLAVCGVLQAYASKAKGVYIYGIAVEKYDLNDTGSCRALPADTEGCKKMIAELGNSLSIYCRGPFGRFGNLNELTLFEELAAAAPHAWFQGSISGSDSYTEQTLGAELKDGQLLLRSSTIEEWEEEEDWDEDDEGDEDEAEDRGEDEDEYEDDEPVLALFREKTYDPVARQYIGEEKEYFREV